MSDCKILLEQHSLSLKVDYLYKTQKYEKFFFENPISYFYEDYDSFINNFKTNKKIPRCFHILIYYFWLFWLLIFFFGFILLLVLTKRQNYSKKFFFHEISSKKEQAT